MPACPSFDAAGGYVGNLVALVDCHSLALGEDGWRALAANSGFGAALGGLLVIYLALLGYRIMLGGLPGLYDGVLVAVRIGIVLALATQWSAFRPLVYDVATRGPDEIAASILAPGGLGGSNRAGLNARVQAINVTLAAIVHPPVPPTTIAPEPADGGTTPVNKPPPPETDVPFETGKTLAAANQILLASTLAGAISVRVVIGLLLALAPIFAACLLFDATRGLFAAWLRVLAGSALGAVAVSAVTALELAIIEPQIRALRRLIDTAQPFDILADELHASAIVFAVVMLATLIAMARATAGPRLAEAMRRHTASFDIATGSRAAQPLPAAAAASRSDDANPPSRAAVIADAARAAERRDAGPASVRILQQTAPLAAAAAAPPAVVPLGQSGRRIVRTAGPLSTRRDVRG